MGLISPQLVIYAVIAAVVGGYIWHCEREKTQFAVFKANVEILGKKAKEDADKKEKADAKKIKDAVSERDAALKRLRERPHRSDLSAAPVAPTSSGSVCFPTSAYNAALGRYRERLERGLGGIQSIATEGDAAQIDAQSLIRAWPSEH